MNGAANESHYVAPSLEWRNQIRDKIAKDIEQGILERLTYATAKRYGVKGDRHIQAVQYELLKSGHLVRRGRMFESAMLKAA